MTSSHPRAFKIWPSIVGSLLIVAVVDGIVVYHNSLVGLGVAFEPVTTVYTSGSIPPELSADSLVELPCEAKIGGLTVISSWLDCDYDIEFRLPKTRTPRGWLTETARLNGFPDGVPVHENQRQVVKHQYRRFEYDLNTGTYHGLLYVR